MPKQNVSALRLEGFDGEWETVPLNTFTERVQRKNTDLQSTLPLTISAQYGLVDQITYFNNRVASADLRNYLLVENGEFAYNKSFSAGHPVGTVKRLDKYDRGVLSSLYIVFRLLEHPPIDGDFLLTFFETSSWHRFVEANSAEGARNHGLLNISAQDFLEVPVTLAPTLEEQQAIGAIFTNLDAAINQHTLKHRALQQAKTALMQRMFPQEGQTVPELRLEGFSGEWDVVKVGAIADSFSGGTPTVGTNAFYGGDIPFIRSSEISSSFTELTLTEAGLHSSSAKMVQPGWVLYALYGATAGEVSLAKIEGAINQAILALVPRDGFNAAYLVAWLRMNKKNITDTYLQGGQGNLSGALVKNLEVSVPPTLEEQQAIGAVFTNLDQLIAAEAQYIVSLKQAKTALLQRMFI